MEWERFRSLSVERYAKMQVDLLKEVLGEDSVVMHDFSGGYFDKCVLLPSCFLGLWQAMY